jgi:exodeoxyribonuclease VII large subunit
VGIITSPTGAVIRDFLNIVGRRHSGLSVLLCAASVQGDSAAGEVVAALECLNASGMVDVIVLARGGGSLEDLAAFNSERVARAIAASKLPVVSAIGHETDFTIADFVADLRAPTPSAAAELITEAQHRIAERMVSLSTRLGRAAHFQMLQAQQKLNRVRASRTEARMAAILHRLEQRLDDDSQALEDLLSSRLRRLHRQVDDLGAAVLRHDPRQRLAHARQHFAAGGTRLDRTMERMLHEEKTRLHALDARLHSLSPLAVLDRGYALVLDEQGALVRSAQRVVPGERVFTRLSDGTFTSRVEGSTTANQLTKRDR